MADTRKAVLEKQFVDADYKDWLTKHRIPESNDYDTKAAFLNGLKPDARGHLDDTYKKDNHITYSTESKRSQEPGAPPAGTWAGDDKAGWTFKASPTNVKNAGGADKLKEYFSTKEPGVKLVLP
jgi:hypothetical protein